jgi:hypothetical protein
MGDFLGSLVQGSQKRTILCVIWGGMLQIVNLSLEIYILEKTSSILITLSYQKLIFQ